MKEDRTVRTIEKQDWFLETRASKKQNIVGSQNISSAQVYLKDSDYYLQVANDRRGAVGEIGKVGCFYDILSAPPDVKNIKAAATALIIQKVYNDLYVFNAMFKQMKEDGVLEEEFEITTEGIGKVMLDNEELVTWV